MSTVSRLPTQHRQHPHCATCDAGLPAFESFEVNASVHEMGETKLLGITYHHQCKCGAEYSLAKKTSA